MQENVVLMRMARESLTNKWGLAIGTAIVYIGVLAGIHFIPGLGVIAGLIISGPLALGFTMFSLSISRNQSAGVEQLFDGFKNFGTSVAAYILTGIFTLLWMLLLIVPGIIAAISYAMTFYIIAEDNTIDAMEAIDKSKKMMYGYKLKFFYLGLRFLLLALLCILTFGIGFLWLIPYMQVTTAKFYDDIKTPLSVD